ncbi:uncharacterized protein LOC102717243 [Oryza brachyantha]|nr:uncharacterized protein LOC102717243 [Oryza brachyantha]
MAESRSVPDWTFGLPLRALETIAEKLPSGRDAAFFRLVCPPWSAALPFERFAPVLMLLPSESDPAPPPSRNASFYSVIDDECHDVPLPELRGGRVVVCGASHGWLALVDEAASVTLLNPFAAGGRRLRVALPPADRSVALASLKTVSMVDGAWVLHYTSGATKPIKLNNIRDIFFREIVLSAPPNNSRGATCNAMAVLANSTEIAFCRLGDTAWTLVDAKLDCPVTSVVYCHDRFVAVEVYFSCGPTRTSYLGA